MSTPSAGDLSRIVHQLADEVADPSGNETGDRWLAWAANFHTYSPRNAALIMQQYPTAKWTMGLRSWNRRFRAAVLRGSRGIRVWGPAMRRRREMDPETGQEQVVEFRQGWLTLVVFDVSQTTYDGPIPNFKRDLGPDTRPLLDATLGFARSRRITCELHPLFAGLNGYCAPDRIVLDRHKVDRAVGVSVQTAVHEVAHALCGHANTGCALPRAVVEDEAESGDDGWVEFEEAISAVEERIRGLLSDEWGLTGVWDLDACDEDLAPPDVSITIEIGTPQEDHSNG